MDGVLIDAAIGLVAITALRQVIYVVTVSVVGSAVTMKILLGVASHAIHIVTCVVCVPLAGFSRELVADAASVTGCALVGLVRFFVEPVSVDKAALGKIGPADVALATAGMTAKAVIVHSLVQRGQLRRIRSRSFIGHRFVGGESVVKGCLCQFCLRLVTFTARFAGIGKGRVGLHPGVGGVHL